MATKLTPTDEIRKRLRSFDRAYYDSVYKQMQYVLGGSSRNLTRAMYGDGDFPVYPDIPIESMKIGRSRRLLNNTLLKISRVLSGEPQPMWKQVNDVVSEIRKEFFLTRYRGMNTDDGAWGREIEQAFIDGDNLGLGFLQIGLKTNPATGFRYVHLQHVPLLQVIWDRHARSVGRARWIAFVHYLAPEDAIARFGEKVAKHTQQIHSANGDCVESIRVTEYYDLGFGKGNPTCAIFVGPWEEEPAVRVENPFDILPFAYYELTSVSGVARAFGNVIQQAATAEGINELETHLRDVVKQGSGIDFYDPNQIDPEDLAKLKRGEPMKRLRLVGPIQKDNPPYMRVPSQEVASSLLQLLQIYERQYNSDSGTTELDRGTMQGPVRSATETQLLDMKSQANSTLPRRQVLAMYKRIVERSMMVAAVGDRDPVDIDVDGLNLRINDTAMPNLRIDKIMEEPSRVVIDQQSVEPVDLYRERAMKLQQLQALQPLVGQTIDPVYYTEQYLKALGEKDPKSWLIQQTPMQGVPTPGSMPQAAPMPGPGQTAMPQGPQDPMGQVA